MTSNISKEFLSRDREAERSMPDRCGIEESYYEWCFSINEMLLWAIDPIYFNQWTFFFITFTKGLVYGIHIGCSSPDQRWHFLFHSDSIVTPSFVPIQIYFLLLHDFCLWEFIEHSVLRNPLSPNYVSGKELRLSAKRSWDTTVQRRMQTNWPEYNRTRMAFSHS